MNQPGHGDDDELRALREATADFRGALARLDAELAGAGIDPGRRRGPGASPVDENCRALLEVVRKRCPGLLPAEDLPPGGVGQPVPLPARAASALIPTAIQQAVVTAATGRTPLPDAELPATVLWEEGPDALLVDVGATAVDLADGMIAVTVPVRCDQLPGPRRQAVTIRFAVGTAERPTGLYAATSSHPLGPPVVVGRWGEALTALAWSALLDVVRGIARRAGRDLDGGGLVPVALVASSGGIAVLPQARHAIDRVTTA